VILLPKLQEAKIEFMGTDLTFGKMAQRLFNVPERNFE